MKTLLKKSIVDAAPVAVIFTIVRFVSPFLFSSFERQPMWINIAEGLVFFLIMTVSYFLYYIWKKGK